MKDPWCFNLIGADLGGNGFLAGDSQRTTKASKSMFAQAHYYMLNVWSLLDLFLDLPCLENTGFDVGYITEVDPLWNDDLLAFLLNPEALLFGNPVLQFSCIADSVAANAGLPLDVLFWCMGSWGSAYPLTGHKGNDSIVEDNAALAGRMIYKLVREYTLLDTATNVCGPTMWPIWTKSHYRLQIMKPVRDYTCQPIGRSGLIWAAGQESPLFGRRQRLGQFRLGAHEEETMLPRVFVVATVLVFASLCAFAGDLSTDEISAIQEKAKKDAAGMVLPQNEYEALGKAESGRGLPALSVRGVPEEDRPGEGAHSKGGLRA